MAADFKVVSKRFGLPLEVDLAFSANYYGEKITIIEEGWRIREGYEIHARQLGGEGRTNGSTSSGSDSSLSSDTSSSDSSDED
jgi:hypothetical protein